METGGEAINWNWSGPENFFSTLQNPVLEATSTSNAGSYQVIVTGTNSCVDSAMLTVIIDTVSVIVDSNSPVCANETIQLYENGTQATSWLWTGPNNFSSSVEDPIIPSADLSNSGVYQVVVSDGMCADSANVTVTVNVLPTGIPSIVGASCNEQDVTLTETGQDIVMWAWSGPNNFMSQVQNPLIPQATAVDEGIYTVIVTDVNGCRDTTGITLSLNDIPVLSGDIDGPTIVCSGLDNIPYQVAEVMEADNYNWVFNGVAGNIEDNNSEVLILDDISTGGTLSLTTSNECGTSIEQLEFDITIGNAAFCALASCLRDNIHIDDELLALDQAISIFRVSNQITSDATIEADQFIIFRAGNEILLRSTDPNTEFMVEKGAIFLADIQSCND